MNRHSQDFGPARAKVAFLEICDNTVDRLRLLLTTIRANPHRASQRPKLHADPASILRPDTRIPIGLQGSVLVTTSR
jgi:hypothetical protein